MTNTGATNATQGERFAAYVERTQVGLDLFAMLTLWIVVAPPGDFSTHHHIRTIAEITRIVVSVVFAVDMAIRTGLSTKRFHYAITHPVGLVSIFVPPLRVFFSYRLIRSMFRRGQLGRYLIAEGLLIVNGALLEYLYEHSARGANIRSLGDSVWWVATTVATVGYGDVYPVTVPGRIIAVLIMASGILSLAVITAQVASSFSTQVPPESSPEAQAEVSLADLETRLTRIEATLAAVLAAAPAPPKD